MHGEEVKFSHMCSFSLSMSTFMRSRTRADTWWSTEVVFVIPGHIKVYVRCLWRQRPHARPICAMSTCIALHLRFLCNALHDLATKLGFHSLVWSGIPSCGHKARACVLTGAHCPAFEEVSAVCSMEGMWRAAGWRAVSPRGPLQRYGFVQRTFCHRVEHNLSI